MDRYVFTYLKNALLSWSWNSKKQQREDFKNAFGSVKEDAFDISLIATYFRKKKSFHATQVLSDKICNDLDIDQLFMFVDRTYSKVGQQYLYNKLRTIEVNETHNNRNENIIAKLSSDENFRWEIQKRLTYINQPEVYHLPGLFQEEHLQTPKWLWVIKALSVASVLSATLTFFEPLFFILFTVLFLINLVIHLWNKRNLTKYVSAIPQLIRLNTVASHLYSHQELKVINPDLPKSVGIINQVKQRMSFFKLDDKLQGEMQIIGWFFFELFKVAFIIEPIILFQVIAKLKTKQQEIADVFSFVGEVDVLLSTAALRAGLSSYCVPTITHQNTHISATGAYHPLIVDCVTNSIQIKENSILLTGSNMSGKTSFIRAIGLNVITGLTLNTCFAASFSLPILKVFSAIRISDDLLNDKSYYFEEVLTIKEMITASEEQVPHLFLLDEIFKGTNTIERISAGKAVLSALAKKNNKVLVSTHDIELTELLDSEYDLYHFSEVLDAKSVGFDYALKEGKLTNRNAIRILEINGYPSQVVAEAMALSKQLDKTETA